MKLNLPDRACFASANQTQIEQIVTNLCINAVHALKGSAGNVLIEVGTINVSGEAAGRLRATDVVAHRGGLYVESTDDGSVHVFSGILSKASYARIRVTDNGHGMSETVAKSIFKPFFSTKGTGGSGLGLSSVLAIVTSYAGAIHVVTQEARGTSISVFLPLAEIRPDTVSVEPERFEDTLEVEPRIAARVLVLDDEPLVADLTVKILEKAGYEAVRFTDVGAALVEFSRDPDGFDLIVTDQTMPNMTGIEFIARVRVLRPNMPSILCTGYMGKAEFEDVPAGAWAILRKPFPPVQLCDAVREALKAC
ncbi:MAG: response regulator [Rhodospirillales bacterium]|nr:response regulator [Rhodospirillales bacterium]